jgi:hypothetical protein
MHNCTSDGKVQKHFVKVEGKKNSEAASNYGVGICFSGFGSS